MKGLDWEASTFFSECSKGQPTESYRGLKGPIFEKIWSTVWAHPNILACPIYFHRKEETKLGGGNYN